MHPCAAVLASVGLLCCTLPSCSVNGSGSNLPTVSRKALQEDILQRLADAGEKPLSVTCKEDLVGRLNATAHCEVVVSEANSFEPIVTVTAVDGAAVDYEMTPAVSRRQLEEVVRRLVAEPGMRDATAVSCQSGIEGRLGAIAQCDVNTGGVLSRRTVAVSGVSGLKMELSVVPLQ